MVMPIDITILTCSGIKAIEKKGILSNKEEILSDKKKYSNIICCKLNKSKPEKLISPI